MWILAMFNSVFLNNCVISIHITQVKGKTSIFYTQAHQAFPLPLYKSFRKWNPASSMEANYLVQK